MQTAVEFLFNELWELSKDKFTWNAILNKAKEMEKQMVVDIVEKSRATRMNTTSITSMR